MNELNTNQTELVNGGCLGPLGDVLAGAAIGGLIAGPAGAIIGAMAGGLGHLAGAW